MTHGYHHAGLGLFALVAAIAFAFGLRVAQIVVGAALIAGLLFFVYVMFRVVMGTI